MCLVFCSASRVQELPLHLHPPPSLPPSLPPSPHPSPHPSPAMFLPSTASAVARVASAQSLRAAATMLHSAPTDVHQDLHASVRTSGTGRCGESWNFLSYSTSNKRKVLCKIWTTETGKQPKKKVTSNVHHLCGTQYSTNSLCAVQCMTLLCCPRWPI